MKRIICTCFMAIMTLITMSFITHNNGVIDLLSTKWISPISDDCHDSLCFTSDKTVMVYRCEKDISLEVGYMIKGNRIEIQAFSKDNLETESQLILYEDNGVLRQLPGQVNTFPRIYIKVQSARCNLD